MLDHIGGVVWSHLASPASVASLAAELAQEFSADVATVADDLHELFATLLAEKLIKPTD